MVDDGLIDTDIDLPLGILMSEVDLSFIQSRAIRSSLRSTNFEIPSGNE